MTKKENYRKENDLHITMNTFESNSGLFFKPIKTHRFFNFGGSLRIITKLES